jgi:predicted RNA-binding Zn-ribbon protein involved in translation (DUF1610 family)
VNNPFEPFKDERAEAIEALRSAGYEQSYYQECPNCGDVLFFRENEYRVGSDEWETIQETEYECPSCGYSTEALDAE